MSLGGGLLLFVAVVGYLIIKTKLFLVHRFYPCIYSWQAWHAAAAVAAREGLLAGFCSISLFLSWGPWLVKVVMVCLVSFSLECLLHGAMEVEA